MFLENQFCNLFMIAFIASDFDEFQQNSTDGGRRTANTIRRIGKFAKLK